MCGISGWIFENQQRAGACAPELEAYIKASLEAIAHRGPDSEGVALISCGAIGARRLAIIDIEGGAQPIRNEDSSVVAVLNGEIYNFLELRRLLEASGHRFVTRTDTEVLVHGYEEWGTRLPEHLEGMFAFAVWDERDKVLLAARDRLGKKPFFYTTLAGGLRFASELKALLSDGAVRPRPDLRSISISLTLQHIPPPFTALEGISQLRGGEVLLYREGRVSTRAYWSLVDVAAAGAASPEFEATPAAALERIESAATARTIADVPVGIFLSGGVDSSLVAATLHRAGHDLTTFSVAFPDSRFDESHKARAVARHIGSHHVELATVAPSAREVASLVWHLDEPLADSSAIPQFLISKAAAETLKVVISGDGGDEFFGGYHKHHEFLWFQRAAAPARALPRAATAVAARQLAALETRLENIEGWPPRASIYSLAPALRRMRRAASLSGMREVDAYLDFLAPVPSFERSRVAGDTLLSCIGTELLDAPVSELIPEVARLPGGLGVLWRVGLVDALTELPGDILVKIDRMSMANSLEIRSPLLDRSIVEWAFSLPDTARRRRGEGKPLLRDAARMVLPPEIAASPKQGFGVPLSDWMRQELGVLAAEVLLDARTTERGWIRRSYPEVLLAQNLAGLDMGPRIWQLLVLELWARAFLDASPPTPPAL